MASNSKKTKFRRKIRRKNMNTERHRVVRKTGTTPVFPVHTPEADANAPNEAKSATSDG